MKFIIILTICFTFCKSFSQNLNTEPLYIYDKYSDIQQDENGRLNYLISIKSRNILFNSDGYKFIIPNQKGFEEFYDIKELGQKVTLDTLTYSKIGELQKFDPCDLHNFLSEKKEIFLVTITHKSLKCYRIIYKGTEKNLEILTHGF